LKDTLCSLAITEMPTARTAQRLWAQKLGLSAGEIEIRSDHRVLKGEDALKAWETYEVKRIVGARPGSGLRLSSMAEKQQPPSCDFVEFTDGNHKWLYLQSEVPTAGHAKALLSHDTGALR
jgi:hypothetical protein